MAFVLRVSRGQCRILNRRSTGLWWYIEEDGLTGARGEARQGASGEATVVDYELTVPTLTLSIPEAGGCSNWELELLSPSPCLTSDSQGDLPFPASVSPLNNGSTQCPFG